MVTKIEWEAIKKRNNYCCIICGESEESVGTLEKAHLKAGSKGGSQILPMCPTHHKKFDSGKFTDKELKKIGLTRDQYPKVLPKKGKKPRLNSVAETMKNIDKNLRKQSQRTDRELRRRRLF